jgi:tetratricopeptide (TPR) repeat protein
LDKRQRTIFFLFAMLAFLSLIIVLFILPTKNYLSVQKNQIKEEISLSDKFGFLNLHDTVKYVGREKCKSCHQDMYHKYMRTGMGLSWDSASKEKSMAVFTPGKPLYDPVSNFYYQPFWEDGIMKVLEFRLKDGDTVYKRLESVQYVVGSGQHTNSHIMNVNGYLYQIPFTFYTQIGLLDFPPGFEDGNNNRFSRPIGFECITCHNSLPEPVEGSINKFEFVPDGINCERCHGPGELHVAVMEKGEVVDIRNETDYTIVNPSKLPVDLQFEICARCHSQGNAVLKEGKDFFDFRPGMYVTEIMDVFREKYENDEDAFWMETHPERLKRSQCFLQTQNNPEYKPLSCITCHFNATNRHVSFRETTIDTFRNQCLSCHSASNQVKCAELESVRSQQNDNCIKCHMITTGVFDIPHVMISDHHIRVTDKWKEPIKSTSEIETGKFLGLKCMTNDNPDKLTWAKAYILHFEKFMAEPFLLDSAYFYLKDFDKEKHFRTWIYYFYLRQDFQSVVKIAKNSFVEEKADAICSYQVGQSFDNLGDKPKALGFYKLAVEKQAFNLDYRNKLGVTYIALEELEKAKKEFEFIISENPKMPIAYNNLGFIKLQQGKINEADELFRKALDFDPDYMNAHFNLVKVYLARNNVKAAEFYLKILEKDYPENREVKKFLELIRK